jgi:hypothetical protein
VLGRRTGPGAKREVFHAVLAAVGNLTTAVLQSAPVAGVPRRLGSGGLLGNEGYDVLYLRASSVTLKASLTWRRSVPPVVERVAPL